MMSGVCCSSCSVVVQAPARPSAAQTAALDKEATERLAERLQGNLGKPLQQSIRQVRPYLRHRPASTMVNARHSWQLLSEPDSCSSRVCFMS